MNHPAPNDYSAMGTDGSLPVVGNGADSFWRRCCQILAYPLLLSFAVLACVIGLVYQVKFALINVLFLLGTIAYLALLEHIIPYEPRWQASAAEWRRDGIYLLISMVGGGSAAAAVAAIAALFSPAHSQWPLWLEVLAALGITSLGSYVFHRVGHVHPWLWRVHGIHHVETKVNVGNNGVNHVLDVFGRRFLAQLPMLLIGLSQPAIFIVSIISTVQGYFVHANIDVRLGWLNYLVASPELHRLHHSDNLEEAGHYSADIVIWDLLFGSFTWRPGRVPKAIGVVKPEAFPPPEAIVASFCNPWRSKPYALEESAAATVQAGCGQRVQSG